VCDSGFGGFDCSQQLCPRGDDPLTTDPKSCGGATCTWEKQAFTLSGSDTLKIGYTDSFNATKYAYVTVDLNDGNGYVAAASQATLGAGPTTTAGKIQAALRSITGGALQRVDVYARASAGGASGKLADTFDVTFVGASGDQYPLTVTSASSSTAALAKYLDISTNEAAVYEVARGNYEEIECSGRGLCDSSSGLCKCFSGYTGMYLIVPLGCVCCRVICMSPCRRGMRNSECPSYVKFKYPLIAPERIKACT
jgi:hypothetical protein